MTIAGAHLGIGCTEAAEREPRQFGAFGRAIEWLNSPRLSGEQLLGKVVLVDFWTCTCINWQRTLPDVRAWSEG